MSLLFRNLSRFFISSASFCFGRSKTSKPPSSFGLQTNSQAALEVFLEFKSDPLPRQCFLNLSICLSTPLGKARAQRWKVGRAVRTAFVNSSFPAWDKKEEVQASLLSHLFTRGRKSSTFGLVWPRGNPRQVKGKDPLEQTNVLAKWLNLISKMLMGA